MPRSTRARSRSCAILPRCSWAAGARRDPSGRATRPPYRAPPAPIQSPMASEIGVVVSGARGKMGQTVVAAIEADEGLALLAAVDIGDDLDGALSAAGVQVMVDFTAPDAAPHNAHAALQAGVAPVIGTTGIAAKDVDAF